MHKCNLFFNFQNCSGIDVRKKRKFEMTTAKLSLMNTLVLWVKYCNWKQTWWCEKVSNIAWISFSIRPDHQPRDGKTSSSRNGSALCPLLRDLEECRRCPLDSNTGLLLRCKFTRGVTDPVTNVLFFGLFRKDFSPLHFSYLSIVCIYSHFVHYYSASICRLKGGYRKNFLFFHKSRWA